MKLIDHVLFSKWLLLWKRDVSMVYKLYINEFLTFSLNNTINRKQVCERERERDNKINKQTTTTTKKSFWKTMIIKCNTIAICMPLASVHLSMRCFTIIYLVCQCEQKLPKMKITNLLLWCALMCVFNCVRKRSRMAASSYILANKFLHHAFS